MTFCPQYFVVVQGLYSRTLCISSQLLNNMGGSVILRADGYQKLPTYVGEWTRSSGSSYEICIFGHDVAANDYDAGLFMKLLTRYIATISRLVGFARVSKFL